MRVADALDRSHDSRVSELRCERAGRTLKLNLISEADCVREAEAAQAKSDLFAEVFDCEVEVNQQTN